MSQICDECGNDKGMEPRVFDLPFIGSVVLLDWEQPCEHCSWCEMDYREANHREAFHEAVNECIAEEIRRGNLVEP